MLKLIEYFLINYGTPQAFKNAIPLELMSCFKEYNVYGSFESSRNQIHPINVSLMSSKSLAGLRLKKSAEGLNTVKSGKLSLNFFKIFLTSVLTQDRSKVVLNGIYDLKLITGLTGLDLIKRYRIHRELLPELFSIPGVYDRRRLTYIHTQERFIQDRFNEEINNTFGMNLSLATISKKDEAPCIKEMRAAFHGHSFTNQLELTNKVQVFNSKMIKKYEVLMESSDIEKPLLGL